jgi:hypothetical protein
VHELGTHIRDLEIAGGRGELGDRLGRLDKTRLPFAPGGLGVRLGVAGHSAQASANRRASKRDQAQPVDERGHRHEERQQGQEDVDCHGEP